MPKTFYRDVIKELTSLGYSFHASGKGSHEKWKQEITGKIMLVPFNLVSRHTANDILKDAGSKFKF